jgi:prepilin peptidase CpaA
MQATQIILWVLAVALTLSAAALDWRSRRIPNWLTVPGLLLGLTAHAVLSGWQGALFALKGAGLALVILLPLVLLRALGAGDWKLMGAVGAMLGPVLFLFVLFGSILAAGLMAVVEVMRLGRSFETMKNLWTLVKGILYFGLRVDPQISLDNPKLMKIPFGVAVAMATLVCFCAARWVV